MTICRAVTYGCGSEKLDLNVEKLKAVKTRYFH